MGKYGRQPGQRTAPLPQVTAGNEYRHKVPEHQHKVATMLDMAISATPPGVTTRRSVLFGCKVRFVVLPAQSQLSMPSCMLFERKPKPKAVKSRSGIVVSQEPAEWRAARAWGVSPYGGSLTEGVLPPSPVWEGMVDVMCELAGLPT